MNFEKAAEEVFQVLRSYDYEVLLFDEAHNEVFEPGEARRLFAKPENLLVSIVDAGEDSAIRLYLSKSTTPQSVFGLIQALRSVAFKYKLTPHTRKSDRDLSPKDFASQHSVTEGKKNNKNEVPMKNILEGMYGTSRSSYLKLENARMIVRHSARIDETMVGARGRNIDAIYIENAVGERHLFPTTHLSPARALTHHVDNGGSWADPVGEQIGRMAQDFADMGLAVRHVNFYGGDLVEAAQDVRASLREALMNMRHTFAGFGRKTRYADVCEALTEMASQPLTESEHDSSRITELAAILNTPSIQLAESVLGTLARVLEARTYHPPKLGKEREVPTVNVFGKPVSKEVWEAFKKGNVEFMAEPDLANIPQFRDPLQKQLYMFNAVAKAVKDNSLSNLLAYVSNHLREGVQGPAYRGLMMIVTQTLRAAGVTDAGTGRVQEVARGSAAIREFDEWTRGFDLPALIDAPEGAEEEVDEVCGACAGDELLPEDALDNDDFETDTDGILTREDVLLPRNQGDDLISQVSTATVVDPDDGHEKAPDNGYINRLLALSGRSPKL